MADPEATGDTLAERWSDVKKAWGWLAAALYVLGYGLASYIQHLIQPFLSVWQIMWITLPLTISITIISFLGYAGKFTAGRAFFVIIFTCLASIVTGLTAGKTMRFSQ